MTPVATLVECAGTQSMGCAYGDNSSDVRRQRSRRALYLGERCSCGPDGGVYARQSVDRSAFDAHYERVRSDPSNTLLAIDDDGEFVGTVGSFTREGEREVTYWIAPARWGQGSRRGPSVRSLRSNRQDHFMVAWPVIMLRRRRCLLERALSRWAPKRRSRQGLAPRSSSASIASIDRRLIPTVNDSWRRRGRAFRRPRW